MSEVTTHDMELARIQQARADSLKLGSRTAAARTAQRAAALADVAQRALGRTAEARPFVEEALRCRWVYAQVAGPNPGEGQYDKSGSLPGKDPLTDFQRHKWRQLHSLTEAQLETALAEPKDLPTFAELLIAANRLHRPEPVDTPPLPEGQFATIVADPPWPMKKIERDVRPGQGRALDYPAMSLDGILKLPVAEHAAEHSHLYLWTTHRFLPAALGVAAAWGFRYQCLLTWVKNVGITPFSWMYDTEHVVFARRGSLDLSRRGLRLSIHAPTAGHSVKPDQFYSLVAEASPGPRLDMFARSAHEGFQPWGAEAP